MARLLDLGNGFLIDPVAQLLELERADYEDSLLAFFEAGWPSINPSPLVPGFPIEAVTEHLEAVVDGEITRLMIHIPPRCLKSSMCSVALPAFVWAQPESGPTSGPGVQFLHASYAEKLSLRDSVKCRRLIESPWYQKRWGERFSLNSDQNTKHRFGNDRGGERLITSIGGTATGEGGDIIIIDDPNAANEAFSEATIESTIEWWDQTMSTRLNNLKTGAFIIIQQRLAENDLSGHILENQSDGWTHLMLPMRYEPERAFITTIGWEDPRTKPGELLWPARFGDEEVIKLERQLGEWGAAGQLQQRPEPKGGGVIKRDWWNAWEDTACGKCERARGQPSCRQCVKPLSDFPPMDFIIASLDTAYTEKTENDPSAMTVWGVFTMDPVAQASRVIGSDHRPIYMDRSFTEQPPKVMLMTAWREWLAFHDLVTKAAKTCKDLKVDLLLIENKANGISLESEIRKVYGHEDFSVQFFNPGTQDKLARLFSVQNLFAPQKTFGPGPTPQETFREESGALFHYRPGIVYAPDRTWSDMVITEVGQFPKGRFRDLTDTTSQALIYLRNTGMLSLLPERLAEIEQAKQYVKAPAPLYPG